MSGGYFPSGINNGVPGASSQQQSQQRHFVLQQPPQRSRSGAGYDHDGVAAGMGALPVSGGATDLSMLSDANAAGFMGGLDIDNILPMDLDMSDAGFGPLQPPQGQGQGDGTSPMHERSLSMGGQESAATVAAGAMMSAQSDAPISGVGAGPLPTGFGMTPQTTSSTLTEFTKRRNWSSRIIEELKDFLHILTPDGRVLYVSPSCKPITGYEPHHLIGKFIGELVHPDDSGIFMREFNESIASGNALRFFYRFKKEDGTYMIFECDGHPHIAPEPPGGSGFPDQNGGTPPLSGVCRGFFMMARPYPTKNAALLDSFLEHKIENERLMKRIEELKREEAEENVEQERLYREQATAASQSQTGATPSGDSNPSAERTSEGPQGATPNYQGMPPPAKPPPVSNTALTRQNLDSALGSQRPDSIADKMSRYEAASTHLESIELLTGLRYRDGERSHGISTGDTSPALVRGDAGIAILLDRDRDAAGRGREGKKKLKVSEEYVCADCGTLDSPEWRKGPKGPKTLCNACGLRWAKKEKKMGGKDGKGGTPQGMSGELGGGPGPGGGGGMEAQRPLPTLQAQHSNES
ncbi:hypothetical protein B0A50_00779 [Salinomyces thailandicus]|uniref:White collar-2 n=1 Tax=Salinomyces thailandicus TaxID=706561 RepID=A0A4U0UF41_9PEZI|nr:hypothetical protein B0A50_00779 [Salinomyces thailandica]